MYIYKLEIEAGAADINSRLADQNAANRRKTVAQLNDQAKQIDDHIAHEKEMLQKGFWECEDGHAEEGPTPEELKEKAGEADVEPQLCAECKKPLKYVKWDRLTPKEQYDENKDQEDALKIAASKRQLALQEEGNAKGGEQMASKFRQDAQNSRQTADRVRKV
jgi:hypothetical protein